MQHGRSHWGWWSQALWASLVGCVLPDYQVVGNERFAASLEKDAGRDASSEREQQSPGLTGAKLPAECSGCAVSECAVERDSCGDDCNMLEWPISPALVPTPNSHAFVKCLANKCDAQCKVTWGCVDGYRWDEPADAYTVAITVNQFNGTDPEVGARVTACLGSDPGCSFGAGMQSSYTTDDAGRVTLPLSSDFRGYFLIEPQGNEYYPMTMLWSQPVYRAHRAFSVNLFKRSWLDDMAASLGVDKNDETAGHVIFRAENCLPLDFLGDPDGNAEAEGVSVAFMPTRPDSTRTFYTRYALGVDPFLMTTKSTGGAGAYGGALNLPSATLTLVGSHEDSDVTHATMRLRANTVGLVHLVPDAR